MRTQWPSASQRDSGETTPLAPRPWASGLQNCGKLVSAVQAPQSVYFVTAARADEQAFVLGVLSALRPWPAWCLVPIQVLDHLSSLRSLLQPTELKQRHSSTRDHITVFHPLHGAYYDSLKFFIFSFFLVCFLNLHSHSDVNSVTAGTLSAGSSM